MNSVHRHMRLISLAILLSALLLCVGVAGARYISTVRGTLGFEAEALEATDKMTLRTQEGWQSTHDGVMLNFTLYSNGTDAAERRAYLRLTATEALEPSRVTVTLTVDGRAYSGVAKAVTAGDPLYSKMGAGTEFRFCSDANELYWPLAGEQTMTLTVQGVSDAALLRLTATEK